MKIKFKPIPMATISVVLSATLLVGTFNIGANLTKNKLEPLISEQQEIIESISTEKLESNNKVIELEKSKATLEQEKEQLKKDKEELNNKVNSLMAARTNVRYRLTSFYSGDSMKSGSCTGSGLCEKDFSVNEHGWYTYDGALVLAGATKECLNSKAGACGKWSTPIEGRHYFKYHDIVSIKIDGIIYKGIILDSCGGSMYLNENRIDLFVSSASNAVDRGYKGKNPALLSW